MTPAAVLRYVIAAIILSLLAACSTVPIPATPPRNAADAGRAWARVLATYVDERVHFALNCMSVSCPRLPQVPFDGAILDRQLDAAAREFFAEPRNLTVDPSRREIRFSKILKFYMEDFLRKAPSLADYADRWRDDKLPKDYEVRFFPYDWTINRQPGAGT